MDPGVAFILILVGAVLALGSILGAIVVFANRRYETVTQGDKQLLLMAILLALVGLAAVIVGLLWPSTAQAQSASPPSWGVRAQISACPPYNPSGCENTPPVWLERSWCGKRAKGWTPQKGELIVTVRCGQ
jgi:hypothetical protein